MLERNLELRVGRSNDLLSFPVEWVDQKLGLRAGLASLTEACKTPDSYGRTGTLYPSATWQACLQSFSKVIESNWFTGNHEPGVIDMTPKRFREKFEDE